APAGGGEDRLAAGVLPAEREAGPLRADRAAGPRQLSHADADRRGIAAHRGHGTEARRAPEAGPDVRADRPHLHPEAGPPGKHPGSVTRRSSRLLLLLLLAAAGGAAVLLVGCPGPQTGPITRVPPDRYEQMVNAFYTGAIAAVSGDNNHAAPALEAASKIFPEEPGTRGDMAYVQLVASNDVAGAMRSLEKASALAPTNARVLFMKAIVENRQGHIEQAISLLRQAIQADPGDLRPRAELIEQLRRQATPESDREIQQQWEKVLEIQPDNLV